MELNVLNLAFQVNWNRQRSSYFNWIWTVAQVQNTIYYFYEIWDQKNLKRSIHDYSAFTFLRRYKKEVKNTFSKYLRQTSFPAFVNVLGTSSKQKNCKYFFKRYWPLTDCKNSKLFSNVYQCRGFQGFETFQEIGLLSAEQEAYV